MTAKHRKWSSEAVRSVADQYGEELQNFLKNRLRNTQNARDLAQEVYLRLLRTRTEEPIQDFRAYMYRIAAHVVHEFRYRGIHDSYVTIDSKAVEDWADHPSHPTQGEIEDDVATERQLEQAFAELQPMCQAVFLLMIRDGLSQDEVAERLELSGHTVKKYFTRALVALRSAKRKR